MQQTSTRVAEPVCPPRRGAFGALFLAICGTACGLGVASAGRGLAIPLRGMNAIYDLGDLDARALP
jgi:hypothetical protein